ncbi:zinc transporter ZIP1-like [Schistocerca americana]|uniref:zinc transporter ZIP1-like n=1 Tax=Schistocerca americana TaxID=7009 RepID=UPI001F4FAA96|nr:zinc transporter ZIP1-like [Schistocerca americana]
MAVDGNAAWSVAAALALLLALRLAAALLPLWAVARMRRCAGHRRLLLLASRFAGGVLLATALLHMLPEARDQLPEHAWGGCLAELLMGAGLLAMYVLEEVWHGRSQPPPAEPPPPPLQLPALTAAQQKAAAPALAAAPACPWPPASRIAPADSTQHLLAANGADGSGGGDAGCTWALILALGVHSLLEGVALGLQATARDAWLLLTALSAHAVPLLLCVGAKFLEWWSW